MAEEAKPKVEGEVNKEVQPEKEQTLETIQPAVEEKPVDTVPLSKFMAEKNAVKELKERIKELENKDRSPTDKDLMELADTYGADPELLAALEKRWGKMSSKDESNPEVLKKLDAIEKAQNAEKIEKVFNDLWNRAMEIAPEFSDVANRDVIKALSLLPENRNLTLTQLLEKSYGNAVKGKKTIESAKPSAKNTGDVDFSKMDDEAWEQVKNSPELKKKYGEYIQNNLRL